MVLIGVSGNQKDVNTQLMFKALEQEPALVLDCANCTRTQDHYSFVRTQSSTNTYVVEVEALYAFQDAIRHAPRMARRVGTRTIIITTFHDLFSQDKPESKEMYEYAWVLLSRLATQHTVIVGVHHKHQIFAQKYCHTILPASIATH